MTDACAVESAELQDQIRKLLKSGSQRDITKAQELRKFREKLEARGLSTSEALAAYARGTAKEAGVSPTTSAEEHRKAFDSYVRGRGGEVELRAFEAGTAVISYGTGALGGYWVPQLFDGIIRAAKAQVAPLADPDLTDFVMYPGPACPPTNIPSFDLSTIAGQVEGEGTVQTEQAVPAAYASLMSPITVRCFLAATTESEQDCSDFTERIIDAGTQGLLRTAMLQVLAGSGIGGNLTGVAKALSATLTNSVGTAGKLALGDLLALKYGVNAYWRKSPRCFVAMPDAVYKILDAAVDTANRPLISVESGQEKLFGKPILVCPELSAANAGVGSVGCILFGSGDGIIIRMGRPTCQRVIEHAAVDVTRGEAGYIFRLRLQSMYYDASASNSNPPLVSMAVS